MHVVIQSVAFNGIYLSLFTEKKAKQRELDMECQRHNSEAVIKGMDEKLKEKEKEHRFVLKFNKSYLLFGNPILIFIMDGI